MRKRRRRHAGAGLLVSLVLHMALFGLLLRPPLRRADAPEKPPIYADIEMVKEHEGAPADQAKITSGTGQDAGPRGDPQPLAAQQAAPAPPPQQAAPAPPPPVQSAEALPAPPAAPPLLSQPAPPPPAVSTASSTAANPPETRLGDTEDLGSWKISGPHVTPPGINAAARNVPPAYPVASAREGEEGVVRLMVTVGLDGAAKHIEVAETSGYERLDHAALEAVSRWHFTPGQQDGIAVESVYPVNIRFSLQN